MATNSFKEIQTKTEMKKKILIIDDNKMILGLLKFQLEEQYEVILFNSIQQASEHLSVQGLPSLVLIDLYLEDGDGLSFMKSLHEEPRYQNLPFVFLSGEEKSSVRISCLEAGAADFLVKPFHPEELKVRLKKIIQNAETPKQPSTFENVVVLDVEMSTRKRIFDLIISSIALLVLSPLLLLIALAIKIDSKGPVFYLSKRVGGGYKIFDLYKFRTMRTDADQQLASLESLNMYKKEVPQSNDNEPKTLLADTGWVSETSVQQKKENDSAFLKFQNDPRITRLGTFLRNTSLDELPQLINIVKGDMSLVGNRPLPIYEAEKLTKDSSVARFLAPAGLTGLWQVSKRGKAALSEYERVELDNSYSERHNWFMDIKLIIRTFPALFQSEKM